MVYLNLHNTNGSPTGENVDPVAALGNNYEAVDVGLTAMLSFLPGSTVNLANADEGQEVLLFDASNPTQSVPTVIWSAGSTGVWHPSDVDETWSVWTTFTIAGSTPAIKAGPFPPSYRTSNFGRIEFRGNVVPVSGNFTNSVWRLLFDGSVATDAIRLVGNRPNTSIALTATSKYFKNCGCNGTTTAGTESNATICITEDSTHTWMQIYYMYQDSSSSPGSQVFALDGLIYERQGFAYAGDTQ